MWMIISLVNVTTLMNFHICLIKDVLQKSNKFCRQCNQISIMNFHNFFIRWQIKENSLSNWFIARSIFYSTSLPLSHVFIAFGWCKIIISWGVLNFPHLHLQRWDFHQHWMEVYREKIDLLSSTMINFLRCLYTAAEVYVAFMGFRFNLLQINELKTQVRYH